MTREPHVCEDVDPEQNIKGLLTDPFKVLYYRRHLKVWEY
jgi:hypothetical protein